jgi:hypothetical protein
MGSLPAISLNAIAPLLLIAAGFSPALRRAAILATSRGPDRVLDDRRREVMPSLGGLIHAGSLPHGLGPSTRQNSTICKIML